MEGGGLKPGVSFVVRTKHKTPNTVHICSLGNLLITPLFGNRLLKLRGCLCEEIRMFHLAFSFYH